MRVSKIVKDTRKERLKIYLYLSVFSATFNAKISGNYKNYTIRQSMPDLRYQTLSMYSMSLNKKKLLYKHGLFNVLLKRSNIYTNINVFTYHFFLI